MESFSTAEKKRLGLSPSPSDQHPQVLRTRKPSQASASGEVGSSGSNGTDFHTAFFSMSGASSPNSRATNTEGEIHRQYYSIPLGRPTPEDMQGDFIDGSGPIFSLYMEMATEEDKKMAEGWKADADGILIFTGLFSAAVASLISVSIQDLRPNLQDTSNFYLANIYRTVADPNRPNTSSSLPSSPPPFSPPNFAVWVNALWFLSLVISISCALLATLLQQWARRYLKTNQPRYSPHKRARIRAFFAEGVDKFLLPWAVEALPTLLHVSLFLFFAGLVVFLWNVSLTIFKLVLLWVGICMALYGCITVMPIFRHDSPYYTPLSLPTWHIVAGMSCLTLRALRKLSFFSNDAYSRFQTLENNSRKLLMQGMQKTAEETALNAPSEIDTRAFLWTLDCLDEDQELVRFFSGLPGFRSSKVVDDPLPKLTKEQQWKLLSTLVGLSDRTFSSNLLPESIKSRRAVICARAINPAEIPQAFVSVLSRIVNQDMPVESVGIARLVRGWDDGKNIGTTNVISAVVSSVVVRAQRRGDLWFAVASEELGVPETTLRDYATHGDSLSLSILIHVTRQQFSLFGELFWPETEFSKVLGAASKFKVRDTKPELQHEFCALWNQIVLKAQDDNDRQMAFLTLRAIRNIYIALHQGTDSTPTRFSPSTSDVDDILKEPTAYPVCNVAGHIHDDSTSTSFAHTPAPFASPDVTSSYISIPLKSPTDVPLLDNSHPAFQTTENLRTPTNLRDPVTTRVIQGDTSATMIPLSAPEPSASTSPVSMVSTSPPGAVTVPHIAERRTSSDVVNVPSLASPIQVLSDALPTESHSSLLAPASPGPPRPRPSSALDPAAVVEGESGVKVSSHEEGNALPSAIRENVMVAPDFQPESRSPSSVTDVAIAGPSWRRAHRRSPPAPFTWPV